MNKHKKPPWWAKKNSQRFDLIEGRLFVTYRFKWWTLPYLYWLLLLERLFKRKRDPRLCTYRRPKK